MRLLIVRLSAMGDVIHGLPLAANAAAAGHEVGWLTGSRYAGLLEDAPFIRRLFLVDTRRGVPSRGGGILAVRRELRAWAPELTIDAQGLWKSALAARLAPAPVIGFSRAERREPGSALLCHRIVAPARQGRHVVERNLSLLEAAGIPVRSPSPDAAFLLDRRSPEADAFLARIPAPFALYHPGTARAEKAWGEERFAELARTLGTRRGLTPVISWGPGDALRVERFREVLP
ncbi:MAG: glycosyltransferase family 9 protein, partial [Thermoanaerobaculia bacterium]